MSTDWIVYTGTGGRGGGGGGSAPKATYTLNTSAVVGVQSCNVTNGTTYTFAPSKVLIGNDGIDMAADADIKIGDRSLKEFMQTMEERLAILVPDPKLLERFEALRAAYDHYKTLEALVKNSPEDTSDNGS